MKKIWDIKLYQKKNGKYKVVIVDESGKKTEGNGRTPHWAYRAVEVQLVINPWLKSEE